MNQSNMMFRPVSFEASMLQMLVTVARIDSCPRWPKHLDLPRYGMPRPHSSLLWGWLTHFIMDAFLAFLFLFLFLLFRAAPTAYGNSQARGQIATAPGLCHSYSNVGSELRFQPMAQLMATLDPSPIEQGQGSNLHPHGS